ncbi:MAG: hypothetical protein WCS37_05650 [Chloroflexota bacterium]|nr:hypothetical protein [Chloroflexota bacterium]
MNTTQAYTILEENKPLVRILRDKNNYTLNQAERKKLSELEEVVKEGFTRNNALLFSAGLSRFDLAVLLGALYISAIN